MPFMPVMPFLYFFTLVFWYLLISYVKKSLLWLRHSHSRPQPRDPLQWPAGTSASRSKQSAESATGADFEDLNGLSFCWAAAKRLKMSGDIGGNRTMPGHNFILTLRWRAESKIHDTLTLSQRSTWEQNQRTTLPILHLATRSVHFTRSVQHPSICKLYSSLVLYRMIIENHRIGPVQ